MPISTLSAAPRTPAYVFMLGFFKAWLTQAELQAVVREWMAPSRFTRSFWSLGRIDVVRLQGLEAQLLFWRVRDHGAVASSEKSGHDMTQASGIELSNLRARPDSARYAAVEEALLPLDAKGAPLWASEWKSPDGRILYIGVARLRHAPHDRILVVADRVGGTYKVIDVDALVEH